MLPDLFSLLLVFLQRLLCALAMVLGVAHSASVQSSTVLGLGGIDDFTENKEGPLTCTGGHCKYDTISCFVFSPLSYRCALLCASSCEIFAVPRNAFPTDGQKETFSAV